MNNFHYGSWNMVFSQLAGQPAGTVLRVPKHVLTHPTDHGARRSIGLPVGQHSDFRWLLGDCRGLHARDFGTHYEAHIDRVDPTCDLIEHLRQDAPGAYLLGAAALGGLIGLLLGNDKNAVYAGATIGAVVGALTTSQADGKETLVEQDCRVD